MLLSSIATFFLYIEAGAMQILYKCNCMFDVFGVWLDHSKQTWIPKKGYLS